MGVWAGMVIMGDTPSWSQVKAIRAPLRKQKISDKPSHVPYRYPLKDMAVIIALEAGPAPNVVGRQTSLPGPAHP